MSKAARPRRRTARRSFTFSVPGFLPVTLNVLLRLHWSKRNRVVKSERQLVAFYARGAGIPKAAGRRRVSVRFTGPGISADPDARLKNVLDGLRDAGALVDDSPAWCELGRVESVRGRARETRVRLEDLGRPKR